jgi:hypothetical protein
MYNALTWLSGDPEPAAALAELAGDPGFHDHLNSPRTVVDLMLKFSSALRPRSLSVRAATTAHRILC